MKISEDKLKEGRELAEKHGFKELFVNEKGEFFTNKSFAAMSVNYDKEQFAEVDLSEAGSRKTEEKATNASTGSATNDLGKAVEVIEAIEVATEVEVVEAIMKAETEGKNRKSVIEAAVKKLLTFKKETEDGSQESGDVNENTNKAE